jgi:hypothetical protein
MTEKVGAKSDSPPGTQPEGSNSRASVMSCPERGSNRAGAGMPSQSHLLAGDHLLIGFFDLPPLRKRRGGFAQDDTVDFNE